MKEFKLTKELKEKWIATLESGEYEQYGDALQDRNNPKAMCCLAVLTTIIPEISISKDGRSCIVKHRKKLYSPFEEMLGNYSLLTRENDNSFIEGVRDYSTIIPLIKQLNTEL